MNHDVGGSLVVAEGLGAVREQLFGVLLLQRLTRAVGLLGVTDVGEGDVPAQLTQAVAQAKRVTVVVGAVVGNDDLGHCVLLGSKIRV